MIRRFAKQIGQLLFVFLVLAGAYTFAMFQGGAVSWTIFYFLLPFVVYSFVVAFYPLQRMEISRTIEKPLLGIGESATVVVKVKRKDRFPLLYLLVQENGGPDFTSVTEGRSARLFVMGMKKEVELRYTLQGDRRGEQVFPQVRLELADFFGWIQKGRASKAKGEASLLIFPETTAVHYVPIGSSRDQGAEKSAFSLIKETTAVTGVREYQPGDQVSWIHWKSFARTQNLMTKEFEDRKGDRAALLLDARPSAMFEEQIRFAASILKDAAARKADLAFFTTHSEQAFIPAISADGQLRHALTQLARIQPAADSHSSPPDYPAALRSAGAIILISRSPDAAFLQPILRAAKNQPVYCFVVNDSEKTLPAHVAEQVRRARTLGVSVQLLRTEQLERSFQEVGKS